MRFKVTQYVTDIIKVEGIYRTVEVENKFEVSNYDDLQSLLLTLVDFATYDTKFKVIKEVIE